MEPHYRQKNPHIAGILWRRDQLQELFQVLQGKAADRNPEENRAIFLNIHEPIIDRITWEKVQSLHTTRRRRTTVTQEPSVFSGVMKCPECGGNLTFHFN